MTSVKGLKLLCSRGTVLFPIFLINYLFSNGKTNKLIFVLVIKPVDHDSTYDEQNGGSYQCGYNDSH